MLIIKAISFEQDRIWVFIGLNWNLCLSRKMLSYMNLSSELRLICVFIAFDCVLSRLDTNGQLWSFRKLRFARSASSLEAAFALDYD